jgi:Domain of unknown function (DUF4145)
VATKEELTLNKTQGKVYRVPCLTCTGKTDHSVLASVDMNGEDGTGMCIFYWDKTYQVIQCLGCKTVSFREDHSHSAEDYDYDEDDQQVYPNNEELYPSRIEGRRMIDEDYYLPSKIRQIYKETLLALINRAPILAGMGMRALLESVCKEKNADGRDLFHQIDNLTQKGILTPTAAEILHKIRTLGNAAAHEVKPHSDKQLGIAMDIVEHLLKDVYILPRQVGSVFGDDA